MSSSQAGSYASSPTIIHPSIDVLLSQSYGSVAQGGLLSNNAIAWLVVENSVLIVDIVSGKVIQSWRPPSEAGRITHVAELCLGNSELLVIGLDQNGCGLAVVLSPNTSTPLRTFEVPGCITSLHAFSSSIFATYTHTDGYFLPDLFQSSVLEYFSGVIAVGCHGGKVYLINLHLNLGDHFSCGSYEFSRLCLIEEDASAEEVRAVGERGEHAYALLTRDCYQRGEFVYRKQVFNPNAVEVTALHLVPQIRCLCVGYSFGSFQLYSLCPMMVICSSPVSQEVAVTNFAYMEPENDPRSFVYLWVATGASPLLEESVGHETKISLYQLIFSDKIPSSHQPASLYHNLQSCVLRLEYPLTSTPSTPNARSSVGSCLLNCFTVQLYHQVRGLEESSEGPNHRLDQTISVFVWNSDGECFLGLFDINQWYQAQMPNVIHWKRSGKYTGVLGCSYFTCYSLKHLMKQTTKPIKSKHFLDVSLSNLLLFNSLSPVPEIHTWPTSLSFHLTALSESSIHHCECYGLQKSTLYELDLCRGALYAQPERFFNMCIQAEMLLHPWEYASGLIDLNLQRKALLTVLLEWDCPSRALGAFIESWLSSGGGTSLLAQWLSQKLTTFSADLEGLCQALVEGSPLSIPLSSYWRQLTAMINLIEKIMACASVSDMSEDSELLCFDEFYCKAITQQRVIEVVTFLTSHNLAGGGERISVPYATLSQRYDQLRCHGDSKRLLAVDYLCEEIDQVYPPQSLKALLSVFETSNILAQEYFMLYWLCDVEYTMGDTELHLVDHYVSMQSLPSHFGVVVYNLWSLDNRKYQKLEKFLWLTPKEITPVFQWHHGVMIDGLLRDGRTSLALGYVENFGSQMQTINSVKAKIEVFVCNQKFHAAHELMVQYDGSENFEDLFNHFLIVNYKVKSLHLIINLPFSEVEEKLLIAYLSQHESVVVREILIFYFLWRHRFVEAVAVHEQIKPLIMNNADSKATEMYAQCEAILRGFIAAVPKTFAGVSAERPAASRITVEASGDSLSSVVAKAAAHEGQIGSQASLIYTVLQSIAESRVSQTMPLTPVRWPGDRAKDAAAVPFLSTPVSVKKARTNSITFASSQKRAPSTLDTPHMTEYTPFASFQAHMLSFRDRFASTLDQSSPSNALDMSNIYTPTVAASSLLTKPLLSVVTPPSILKGHLSSSRQPGTEGKKIRFAVESPPITPFQERAHPRRLPSSYTPGAVSSLTTTAASMAASTPLPSSDDSDLFKSPAESPSQLGDSSLQNITMPPRFQLDEGDNMISVEDMPHESQEVDAGEEELNDKTEDSHRSVEQSLDDEDGDAPSKIIVPLTQSGLQEKPTRDSISSVAPSPLKLQSPHELAAKGTLPIYVVSSSAEQAVSAKPTPPVHVSSSAEPVRLFSPIPLLSELVESKKVKLLKSIEETKRRHATSIKEQSYFSPTMVKHTADSGISTTASTVQGTQYSFSPPTEMHDHQVSKTPASEAKHISSFVFSPPLTRSAARRMKEKGGDASVPVIDLTSAAKKGRLAKEASTPLRDASSVALITPPSHPPASTATSRGDRKRVKRVKPVKSGVQTRRSARLLTGKK